MDVSKFDLIVLFSSFSAIDTALGNCTIISTKLILQSNIELAAYTATDYVALCKKHDAEKVKIRVYSSNCYAVLYGMSFDNTQ